MLARLAVLGLPEGSGSWFPTSLPGLLCNVDGQEPHLEGFMGVKLYCVLLRKPRNQALFCRLGPKSGQWSAPYQPYFGKCPALISSPRPSHALLCANHSGVWTVDNEEIGKIMTAGPVSEFFGGHIPLSNLTAFDSLHLFQLLLQVPVI